MHRVRLRGRAWSLLSFALLLIPVASAAAVEGELHAEGPLIQPAGTHVSLTPLALFANGTGQLQRLDLIAPAVEVTRVTTSMVDVRQDLGVATSLVVSKEIVTYRLTNVSVRLLEADPSDHAGWMGIHPAPGLPMEIRSSSMVDARWCPSCHVGNTLSPEPSPNPASAFYYWRSVEPVVSLGLAGAFSSTGGAALKILGADLRIAAEENTTVVRTGVVNPSGPASPNRTEVQLFLAFDGILDWATDATVHLATDELASAFDGTMSLTGGSGAIRSDEERFTPTSGAPTTIRGELTTIVRPHEESQLRVAISGEMRSTTMQVEQLPLAMRIRTDATDPGLLLFATAVVVAGGGAAAVALRRRARTGPSPDVDELIDLAQSAAERGDHALALAWTRRAKRLIAPNARLLADEAYHLHVLGNQEEAMRVFAEASSIAPDGEVDLLAARTLAGDGAHGEEVRPWIERALEKSPELFVELDDDEFTPLRRAAWFQTALHRAESRAEEAGIE